MKLILQSSLSRLIDNWVLQFVLHKLKESFSLGLFFAQKLTWRTERARSVPFITEDGELRLACILDDFSFTAISSDSKAIQLHRDEALQQLVDFRPSVLFVESAWFGVNGEWRGKVAAPSPELAAVIHWCRNNSIPTVFWNKEDPVHFKTFIRTAALFDWIFTTDSKMIKRYNKLLGHSRVNSLQFSVDPRVFHPFEKEPRAEHAVFAGSFYKRYLRRNLDFRRIWDCLPSILPSRIYERVGTGAKSNFPYQFRSFVRTGLRHSEIPNAFRASAYAINLNTVRNSPTMFSRRALEIIATNTPCVSNWSDAMEQEFGKSVIFFQDCRQLRAELHLRKLDKEQDAILRAQALNVIHERFGTASMIAKVQQTLRETTEGTQSEAPIENSDCEVFERLARNLLVTWPECREVILDFGNKSQSLRLLSEDPLRPRVIVVEIFSSKERPAQVIPRPLES